MVASQGKPAPSFTLPDADGYAHQLKEYPGKRLLVFLRYLG